MTYQIKYLFLIIFLITKNLIAQAANEFTSINRTNISFAISTQNFEDLKKLASIYETLTNVLNHTIYPIIIFTGSILNILTIVVFTKSELSRLTISIYTISLAATDLSVLIFPVTLTWLHEFIPHSKFFQTKFWCQTHGYFDMVLCCCSSWTVVAISYERWVSVCKQRDRNIIFKYKRALINIFFIILFSILLHLWYPFLLHAEFVYDRTLQDVVTECDVLDKRLYRIFGTFSISCIYVVPFIFISILNGLIVRKICQRIQRRKKLFGVATEAAYNENRTRRCLFLTKKYWLKCFNKQQVEEINMESFESVELQSNTVTTRLTSQQTQQQRSFSRQRQKSINKKESDLAINIMLVAISITFLILIFPYQLLWFYDEYRSKPSNQPPNIDSIRDKLISVICTDITLAVRNLNFAVNFLFYSTLSKQFRRELFSIFSFCEYVSKTVALRVN